MRPSTLWLLLVVTVLIVLLSWQKEKKTIEISPLVFIKINPALSTSTITSSPASTSVGTNTLGAHAGANTTVPPQNKGEPMKEELAAMNDVPIIFYGRLTDQFGSPVVGAQIVASVRIYNGVQSTVDRFSTASDGNGYFQINHGKGESLSVVPSKTGYVRAMSSTSYNYSYMYPNHFIPDQGNPTVIRMWKLQGAEPLVDISKEYKLTFTSVPINFDLVAGKIVPTGGDLRITVNRPTGEVSEHNPQDWGFEIEAVAGGLIETSGKEEAVTFAAPENGYQPSDTLTTSSNRHGIGGIQQSFFVQSRNGQVYSKISLSFGINEKPDGIMYVTLRGVANTNSSRNWEATAPQQ